MARRKSASIQARHAPGCALGKAWTPFDVAAKGCTCKGGPLYHIVSRPDGKQVREVISRNREHARRELLRVLGAIDEGTYEPPSNVTFREWADEWKASLRRPVENTTRSYVATLDYAREAFGDRPVRHISSADVSRFLDLMDHSSPTDKRKALSPTTKRKHLRVLHSCLQAALTRRPALASFNAVAALERSQVPAKQERKGSPFEDAELRRIWQQLDDPYLTLCKLAAATGMRQGELIGLRWGSVDFAASVIRVRGAYTPGVGFVAPKSEESVRDVILTPGTADLLRDWRGRQETLAASTALVFPGGGCDGQIVDSTLRGVLYDAMVAAGVARDWKPGHKPRDFHSLRHTYARIAIGQGIGLEWIAEQLGHSSVSVTERSYKHFMTDARQAIGTAMNDALVL